MTPPKTQNSNVAPTLLREFMIPAGVEYIPEPTTRLMIRKAVDHVPSFLSVCSRLCQDAPFSLHLVTEDKNRTKKQKKQKQDQPSG